MPRAAVKDLDIEYLELGAPDGDPMLLIMGLAGQLIDWPENVRDALVERGFRIILFDNRDSGLSSHLDDLGVPDLPGIAAGTATAPYTVSSMAEDAIGLLDALQVDSAHVLGVSLGGVIAQVVALNHPQRVRSLNLAMTSGSRAFSAEPLRSGILLTKPDRLDREVVIANDVAGYMWCGSPYEVIVDEKRARERAVRRYERSYRPSSAMRHVAAALDAPERLNDLANLRIPTLVLHGEDDPIAPIAEGRQLASAIHDSQFMSAERRGHQPEWLSEPEYADAIEANSRRAFSID